MSRIRVPSSRAREIALESESTPARLPTKRRQTHERRDSSATASSSARRAARELSPPLAKEETQDDTLCQSVSSLLTPLSRALLIAYAGTDCICLGKDDESSPMIQCEFCSNWYVSLALHFSNFHADSLYATGSTFTASTSTLRPPRRLKRTVATSARKWVLDEQGVSRPFHRCRHRGSSLSAVALSDRRA